MNKYIPKNILKIENFVHLLLGVTINLFGMWLSHTFMLPVRLNCIGTMYTSCMFGSIGGISTAIITTLLASITDRMLISYLFQTIVIAALCGMFYAHKEHKVVELVYFSFILCFTGTLLALPFNLFLRHGHCGNIWGDALFDLMAERRIPVIVNSILGEFLVEFPDMMLSVFLATGCHTLRKRLSSHTIANDKENES